MNSSALASAVTAARTALPGWMAVHDDRRQDMLLRIAAAVRDDLSELSRLGAIEIGLCAQESLLCVGRAAGHFMSCARRLGELRDEVVPVFPQRGFDYTRGEPHGVVGVITSRAGALPEMTVTVAAALAAGNAVVLKPSERASGTALRFAGLCSEAGLPSGLLSVVTGGDAVGEALVCLPGIDRLSFSGSPGTARRVMIAAAQRVRPVGFRLVGQTVGIVFADSDPERSLEALRRACADGLGPRGTSPLATVLIEHAVYDDVPRRLLDQLGGAPADSEDSAPSVIPFRTEEDVLALVDGSPHPRSVLLYTNDLSRAHALAEGLDAASVSINRSGVPVEEPDIRAFRRTKNVFIDLSA